MASRLVDKMPAGGKAALQVADRLLLTDLGKVLAGDRALVNSKSEGVLERASVFMENHSFFGRSSFLPAAPVSFWLLALGRASVNLILCRASAAFRFYTGRVTAG